MLTGFLVFSLIVFNTFPTGKFCIYPHFNMLTNCFGYYDCDLCFTGTFKNISQFVAQLLYAAILVFRYV